MSRGSDQAFPRHEKHFDGLTLREYLVGQALIGVAASRDVSIVDVGRRAVFAADAALEAMKVGQ